MCVRGKIYGLVAPGYEMAEAVANTIVSGEEKHFKGADMSTKLKLMGVDVASFGRYSGFKVRRRITSKLVLFDGDSNIQPISSIRAYQQ